LDSCIMCGFLDLGAIQGLRFRGKKTKILKQEGVGSVPQKEVLGHDSFSSSAAEG
jgi:hypothetical protein